MKEDAGSTLYVLPFGNHRFDQNNVRCYETVTFVFRFRKSDLPLLFSVILIYI
jgi:hypothetical protein